MKFPHNFCKFANLQICTTTSTSSSQQINAMPFFLLILLFTLLSFGDSVAENLELFFLNHKFCTPCTVLSSFYRQSRLGQWATLFPESVLPNLQLCGLQRQLGREIHFQVAVLSHNLSFFLKGCSKENTIYLNIANVNIFEFCLSNLELCCHQSPLVREIHFQVEL